LGRIARVVVPGYPHHVTQRGSRRQKTFLQEADYLLYLTLMAKHCQLHDVEVWAYCLMPNHVHLIVVPSTIDGLARAIGGAHRSYAVRVNEREGWRGHLWQERFSSFVMDESYLLSAVRYVELNPVRGGLVEDPGNYKWSSASAHLAQNDDLLVKVRPMLDRIPSWEDYLAAEGGEVNNFIHKHGKTGRPLGRKEFVSGLEKMLGRSLQPQKPGRRKRK